MGYALNAASPRFWRRLAEEKEERERSFSKVASMPLPETIAPTDFLFR